MRTVKDWKSLGFEFEPSKEVPGKTEVSSSEPFWCYNAQFYVRMDEVYSHLELAIEAQGRHRMLVSGFYRDDQLFPIGLVKPQQKAKMDQAKFVFALHRSAMAQAADAYLSALKSE